VRNYLVVSILNAHFADRRIATQTGEAVGTVGDVSL